MTQIKAILMFDKTYQFIMIAVKFNVQCFVRSSIPLMSTRLVVEDTVRFGSDQIILQFLIDVSGDK